MAERDNDQIVTRDFAMWSELRGERAQYEDQMDKVNRHFNPFRGDLLGAQQPGADRIGETFDTTGIYNAHELVNFILQRIYPANSFWLRLRVPGVKQPMFELLQAVDAVNSRFVSSTDQSNYFSSNATSVADHLVGGNACTAIEPYERDGVKNFSVTSIDFGRVWTKSDKQGRVETGIVEYTMTADSALEFFSGDPGEAVRETLKSGDLGGKKPVTYIHVFERNPNYTPNGTRLPSRKRWASRWLSVRDGYRDRKALVRSSAFDVLPYSFSRWMRVRNEEYGRGLGHIGLHDAAGLDAAYSMMIEAFANGILPTLAVADKDQLSGQLGPNGIVTVRQGWMAPTYLQSGADLEKADALFGRQRQQLNQIFLSDALRPPETQDRSAAATLARQANQLAQLSTFATSIMEFLADQVAIILNIKYAQGELPEMDVIREITGSARLEPVFVSPFFAAQRIAASQQNLDFVAAVVELANKFGEGEAREEILEPLKLKMVTEILGETASVDHRMFFTKKEREQRAERKAIDRFQEKQAAQIEAARIAASTEAPRATPSLLGRPA